MLLDAKLTLQRELKDVKLSKLSKPVQELILLIFNLNMMNRQMKDRGYDIQKLPVGKLSLANIQKGFAMLKNISEAINNKSSSSYIEDLSSNFYSLIPHDFGIQY